MNYTKTIRDYCLQNTGKVFDVSYEHKRHFDMVPYKTFSKIVGRLEEEGTLKLYSKGIFLIVKNQNEDDPIISFYASNDTGMVVGYDLYNKLEVTSHKEKPTVIYTMAMDTSTKNIGDDYRLIRFPIFIFDSYTKDLIACLELIENGPNIIGRDFVNFNESLIYLLQNYSNGSLKEISKAHQYKYSTYCTLETLLNELHIENNALEIGKESKRDS